MRIAVVGAGYVGAVSAAGFSAWGHEVRLFDLNRERARATAAGAPDINEPGLDQLIREAKGRLVSADTLDAALDEAGIALVCVGTPSMPDGSIDLVAVLQACRDVVHATKPGQRLALVIRSTVVPGTTDRIDGELLATARSAGRDIEAAVNPEFLREGRAVEDFLDPDRIVIGAASDRAAELVSQLYVKHRDRIMRMSRGSAELAKYANNALLALMVSFSNELAAVAEAIDGVDVEASLRALHADRRWTRTEGRWAPGILSYLWPGCGYGGSCLPKDVKAIVCEGQRLGIQTPLLAATDHVNELQPGRLADRIDAVRPLAGTSVAVLGTAFKDGTADSRTSPGLAVAEELRRRGARIRLYDPLIRSDGTDPEHADDLELVLRETEVWVVATGAPEFEDLPERSLAAGALLVDARRRYARRPSLYLGPGWSLPKV